MYLGKFKRSTINLAIIALILLVIAAILMFKNAQYQADSAVTNNYDVAIVGAGSSGIAAAIQAARDGSKVVLIEESGNIGGQLLTVSTMDEGGDEAKYGIYKEFRSAASAYYQSLGKSMSTCYWGGNTACIEPKVVSKILNGLITTAGNQTNGGKITLMLNTKISSVTKKGDIVTGAITSGGVKIASTVLIDATEYGDIIPLTGAEYRVGNTVSSGEAKESCVQDITYLVTIKKYSNPVSGDLKISQMPPDYEQAKTEFAKMITKNGLSNYNGTYPVNFIVHNQYRGLPNSSTQLNDNPVTKTSINWANDFIGGCVNGNCAKSLSSKYLTNLTFRTTTNCQAKLKTVQFLYYIQNELGESNWSFADDEIFKNSSSGCNSVWSGLAKYNKYFAPYPYTRESTRIVGVKTLDGGDIKRVGSPAASATVQNTSVAVGYYPTDFHNCSTANTLESDLESAADITAQNIKGPFQIPIESFIPKKINGFLAAEKNISQSRIANSATRLQPITMLSGQAVGALAAVSAKNKIQPRNIKAARVQKVLADAKVRISLTEYSDVAIDNPLWSSVQVATTNQIMSATSGSSFALSQKLTRAQAATIIVKLFALSATSKELIFKDVKSYNENLTAINALYNNKITSGCSTSPLNFCPEKEITRAEFTSFLVRAMKLGNASKTTRYSDVATNYWNYNDIQKISSLNTQIVPYCNLSDHNKFCPSQIVTRGEMAQIVTNVLYYNATK